MNCNICMEKINNSFIFTNCKCQNIIYHKKCIEKWLNISNTCPFCKKEYKSIPFSNKNQTSLLEKALFLDSINRFPTHTQNDIQINQYYDYYRLSR
jgi:hypothetical protein